MLSKINYTFINVYLFRVYRVIRFNTPYRMHTAVSENGFFESST